MATNILKYKDSNGISIQLTYFPAQYTSEESIYDDSAEAELRLSSGSSIFSRYSFHQNLDRGFLFTLQEKLRRFQQERALAEDIDLELEHIIAELVDD